MLSQRRQNRNMIGGPAGEAAKQPIIHAKCLRVEVKNWEGGERFHRPCAVCHVP